jgi:hypothetical protein
MVAAYLELNILIQEGLRLGGELTGLAGEIFLLLFVLLNVMLE